MEQVPVATVPVQLSVPLLTVTLPVGLPAVDVTVKLIVTLWPTTDGSGVSDVIAVVVTARLTWCGSGAEVLVVKFASPASVAVSGCEPAVLKVSEQVPAATVPVQLVVPLVTVTLPVGVPAPGAVTATL